jgi:hypothetical protein
MIPTASSVTTKGAFAIAERIVSSVARVRAHLKGGCVKCSRCPTCGQARRARHRAGEKKVAYNMNTPDKHKHKQQGGLWTWIIVGLLYSAVLAALYGPFIWELIYSA